MEEKNIVSVTYRHHH